jgi:hypothetical protein
LTRPAEAHGCEPSCRRTSGLDRRQTLAHLHRAGFGPLPGICYGLICCHESGHQMLEKILVLSAEVACERIPGRDQRRDRCHGL